MTPGTLIAAVIACDRLPDAPSLVRPTLEAVAAVEGLCRMYVNVETDRPERWTSVRGMLSNAPLPTALEIWNRSGWEGSRPEANRDQRRLLGIVTARNMAIDYALYQGAEWLLFVDADVTPRADGLSHLLGLGRPLCGGFVPGRGEHTALHYVFPGHMADPAWDLPITEREGTIRCGFGTCGYMLIHASVFSRLRFRSNPQGLPGSPAVAEDPAYCHDAVRLGLTDAFYIATQATASHTDGAADQTGAAEGRTHG